MVATILATPGETPVTVPLEETVATAVLLDDQVTDLSTASDGDTVAAMVDEAPTLNSIVGLLSVIPETWITFSVTVIFTELIVVVLVSTPLEVMKL